MVYVVLHFLCSTLSEGSAGTLGTRCHAHQLGFSAIAAECGLGGDACRCTVQRVSAAVVLAGDTQEGGGLCPRGGTPSLTTGRHCLGLH